MEEKKELLDHDERVVEIELERLRGFVNHPFKVQADSQMIDKTYSMPKLCVSYRKPRKLTALQRAKARERIEKVTRRNN